MLNQAFSKTLFLFITYLRVTLKFQVLETSHVVQNLQLPEFHGHTFAAVITGLEERTQKII